MNWLRKFMAGRYGADHLSTALMVVYFIMVILSAFIKSKVMAIVQMAIPIIAIYRMFSKNVSKRYQENVNFLNFWYKIKGKITNRIRRIKNLRHYRYYKCSSCRQSLRVPRGKGKVSITCPKCKNTMIRKS